MPSAVKSRWAQACAVALLLAGLAALAYGSNVVHGGFLSDAWANRAIYVFAPDGSFFGEVDRFLAEPNIAARPLYAVYLVVLNGLLGEHMGLWLAWLGATSVLMSLSLYLLLRKLDFEFFDATSIACLVLVFPAASSLRLWAATVQIPVSISLAILGFLLALVAFDAKKTRRTLLHGISLTMFVASVLLYEVALPLMLVSVLLYRVRVPWSRALPRWVVDLVVLISVASFVASSAPDAKDVQGLYGMWDHATVIFNQAWTLLARDLLPLGGHGWYAAALVGLVALTAGLVARRLSPEDPGRARLLRWLWVLAGSMIVIVLGYAVFVPGIDYYQPLAPGIADRVNAVPSIGLVLVLYSLLMLVGTLALRVLRGGSPRLISGLAVLVCALIGVGWVQSALQDADSYADAYNENKRVLAAVRAAVPEPPPGSTIWTFGQPVEVSPGVPVFGNTWDMTSSVQLMYDDPTLRSYVGFPGTTFDCSPYVIVPGGNPSYPVTPLSGVSEFASAYGRTYFVDTTSSRAGMIGTPEQCRRAVRIAASLPGYPVG